MFIFGLQLFHMHVCARTTVRAGLVKGFASLSGCTFCSKPCYPGLPPTFLVLFVVLVYFDGSNQLGCCS